MARNTNRNTNRININLSKNPRRRSRVRYTKCASCKGEGRIPYGILGMSYETCKVCGGTGKARLR